MVTIFHTLLVLQSSMIVCMAWLISLSLAIKAEQKPHGEKCVYDGDCKEGLNCGLEDKLFNPQRICQCSKGKGGQNFLKVAESKSSDTTTV